MRELLLRMLTVPAAEACFAPLLRNQATIFMLHRMADPEQGVLGNTEEGLRRGLERLRRSRRRIVSLEEIFRCPAEDAPLKGAVAFSVDDGYEDQATRFAPIFAEFDCPATIFVCTGFLDGEHWFWWDRIEYAFRHTARRQLRATLGGRTLHYELDDPAARDRAQLDFIERCKRIPSDRLPAAIDALAREAEVELPDRAPAPYRPMSWEGLRACERMGIRFGPHTVNHPILSQASDEQSEQEIRGSWERLREEAAHPVPIFCYPNGQTGDFGLREFEVIEKLGLRGAVAGTPGYASRSAWRRDPQLRYRVPRFTFPDSLPHLVQYSSGLERAKQIARRDAV